MNRSRIENMKTKKLGKVKRTARGFDLLEFQDCYKSACSLQASSLAVYEKPGTSAVWLGVDDPQPQVMARDAASVGVKTDATTGWVPYPIPEQVLLTTRMHLDREQVEALIGHLQRWLDTNSFAPRKGGRRS